MKNEEKLKNQLSMIFGDVVNGHLFTNIHQIEIIYNYGMMGFDFHKCLELASRHIEIINKCKTSGISLSDISIYDLLRGEYEWKI